jgi:class 3 adenylate cyclase
MERKLTAILSADVKGYSRLMGDDEEATICTLTTYREVMSTLIQQHHGRVVDSPGDNLLAEFASAVDAVQGAIEIQKTLGVRNAELSDGRKMEYRIGINVGDVVVEGERIYGDGVNIAARLEALAQPGGICISGTVHDQVENKLGLPYEYVGEQIVKNIAKPVRVYRITIEEEESQKAKGKNQKAEKVVSCQLSVVSPQPPERRTGLARHKWTLRATAGLLLLAGAIVTVRYFPLPLFTFHSPLRRHSLRCRCPTNPPSRCCRSPT